MLFEINLSDMKALCIFDTNFGRSFLRRLVMVFETILYKTLQRLMGLKSVAFSWFFVFGISEMKVWLRLSGMAPELSITREVAITS